MTSTGNGEYYLDFLGNGCLARQILDLGGPVIVQVQTCYAGRAFFIIACVDGLCANGVICQLFAVDPYFIQRNLEVFECISGEVFGFAVRSDHNCQELYGIRTAASGNIPGNGISAVAGDGCDCCAFVFAGSPVLICAQSADEVCLTDCVTLRYAGCDSGSGGFRSGCCGGGLCGLGGLHRSSRRRSR